MDAIDCKIIEILQEKGRISIKKLAETVSLTPPAVAQRIRQLERTGVITGYRAVVNPRRIGFHIRAIINVTLSRQNQEKFLEFVKYSKHILKCHHVTGDVSMSVEALFEDMAELEAAVGKIQQFGDTQTLVVLSSPIESTSLKITEDDR